MLNRNSNSARGSEPVLTLSYLAMWFHSLTVLIGLYLVFPGYNKSNTCTIWCKSMQTCRDCQRGVHAYGWNLHVMCSSGSIMQMKACTEIIHHRQLDHQLTFRFKKTRILNLCNTFCCVGVFISPAQVDTFLFFPFSAGYQIIL